MLEGSLFPFTCSHFLLRLWDYFNHREEETLESLVGPPTSQGGGDSSNERSQAEQQELFWLHYEPDVDDLEFI